MLDFLRSGRVRKWMTYGSAVCVVFLVLAVGVSTYIDISTRTYRYSDVTLVPKNPVGLILGTSKFLDSGEKNSFFISRIWAVKELYDAGKIDCVLISGDNRSASYNEPIAIQTSLLELGIPAQRMYLDYAGVRTLDSVIRAKEVFSLDQFTIISQPFHNARALFLAREYGETPIAYDASSIDFFEAPFVYVRELFSRVVAVYDAYVDTTAKFGGARIHIEYDPNIRPVPEKICTPRHDTK